MTTTIADFKGGDQDELDLFELLPDESLLEIAVQVSRHSLSNIAALARVNSRWNRICKSDDIHRRYLAHKYGLNAVAQQKLQASILEMATKRGKEERQRQQGEGRAWKNLSDIEEALKQLYEDDSWRRVCLRLETNTTEFIGYATEPSKSFKVLFEETPYE